LFYLPLLNVKLFNVKAGPHMFNLVELQRLKNSVLQNLQTLPVNLMRWILIKIVSW